ncbi:hypothetical protein V8E55_001226 [Tylopilus felleus]
MGNRNVVFYLESNAGTNVSKDCPWLRLELEHGKLLSRVNYLTDEVTTILIHLGLRITEVAQIVLEKRVGIAQLCLLLAVLLYRSRTWCSCATSSSDHASVNT